MPDAASGRMCEVKAQGRMARLNRLKNFCELTSSPGQQEKRPVCQALEDAGWR